MNISAHISQDLELIVIHDARVNMAFKKTIKEGVQLQREVFRQQGIPYARERVLPFKESYGTRDEEGALDGTTSYHHIYLRKNGKVIGMRATEEFRMPSGTPALLDWFSAILLEEESGRKYGLDSGAISDIIPAGEYSAFEILTKFNKHLNGGGILHFADRLGAQKGYFEAEYGESAAGIWLPPLTAYSKRSYMRVMPEPVRLMMLIGNWDRGELSLEDAKWLFVDKYLNEGYIGEIEELGLKFEELPCYQKTMQEIESNEV